MSTYLPTDDRILVFGRTKLQNPLPLFWTGSGLEFMTDGSELSLEFETDYEVYEQWIRMEIDGATVLRMPLERGRKTVTLFRNLSPGEKRRIRIFREMQALSQDPKALFLVHSLTTDGTLYPVPPYKRRIEVVGDSLTSGEGLAGAKNEMTWGSLVHSTEGHYVERLRDLMNAEVRHISQGGWGVYISWDGETDNVIPRYYQEIAGVLSGERNLALGAKDPHDFSSWPADAVVVNLGTNDGTGLGVPLTPKKTAVFIAAVKDFLYMLRRCNPDSYLLWAYGMCGTPMAPHIQAAVDAYRAETKDPRVSFLSLSPSPDEWLGSRGHPGPKSHALAAEEIAEVLEKVL